LWYSSIYSQEGCENLFSGVVNLNHSLQINNRYQLKSGFERRLPVDLSNKAFFSGTVVTRNHLTIGIQRKLSPLYSIAAGGIYRISEGGNKQRLFQQIAHVQQTLSRFKIAHRLRLDKTFSNLAPEYRIRYRLGAELPSRGFRVDPGETYFALLSEFLMKYKGDTQIPELRITTQLGYLFKGGNKGEFLFDVRIQNPGANSENLFLIGLGYYFSN